MCAAFQEGEDVHHLPASCIAGKPEELVRKQKRHAYKVVNFAFIRGMAVKSLRTAEKYRTAWKYR